MNRTLQPEISGTGPILIFFLRCVLLCRMECRLTIINAGEQDVVRVDIFVLEADDGNNHKNCRHYLPIACYVKDPENIQRRR